jgi:hypothetical protein
MKRKVTKHDIMYIYRDKKNYAPMSYSSSSMLFLANSDFI